MPRARIDKLGPVIAKQGYDIDTAPIQHIAFDPRFIAARIHSQVTVTVAPFTGWMSESYYRAVHTYAQPFAVPPIIIVAGIDGARRQVDVKCGYAVPFNPGTAYRIPGYEIRSLLTGFELYVSMKNGPGIDFWNGLNGTPAIPTQWRCTILQNSYTG